MRLWKDIKNLFWPKKYWPKKYVRRSLAKKQCKCGLESIHTRAECPWRKR